MKKKTIQKFFLISFLVCIGYAFTSCLIEGPFLQLPRPGIDLMIACCLAVLSLVCFGITEVVSGL
jgi:hypothetical protein